MLDFLREIDTNVFLGLNQLHTPFGDAFMSTFTGKLIWVPMYAVIVYILYKKFNWKVATCFAIGIILTIALADSVCAKVIRPFAERLRPANLENPISDFVHIVDGYRGGIYGFPSCHAANSFALATFLSLLFRKRWIIATIFLWAAINSYSRLYIGVHYVGDLLVGSLIGTAFAFVLYYTSRYIAVSSLAYTPQTANQTQTHELRLLPATFALTVLTILIYATCVALM